MSHHIPAPDSPPWDRPLCIKRDASVAGGRQSGEQQHKKIFNLIIIIIIIEKKKTSLSFSLLRKRTTFGRWTRAFSRSSRSSPASPAASRWQPKVKSVSDCGASGFSFSFFPPLSPVGRSDSLLRCGPDSNRPVCCSCRCLQAPACSRWTRGRARRRSSATSTTPSSRSARSSTTEAARATPTTSRATWSARSPASGSPVSSAGCWMNPLPPPPPLWWGS